MRPGNDHLRLGEWRCVECGRINDENEGRCWGCDCDQDGNLRPKEDGEESTDGIWTRSSKLGASVAPPR